MNILIFFVIAFSGSLISKGHVRDQFVVWNVGQGQWATANLLDECLHFDMGGEFFPWKKIHQACAGKENKIYLSHSDWDHVGALNKKSSFKKWAHICVALAPLSGSLRKQALWKNFPACKSSSTFMPKNNLTFWSPLKKKGKDSNSESHVITWRNILIPGDSPKQEERQWQHHLDLSLINLLLLGHHGSRTSSGEDLFERLPTLRQAISSARWQRYKHPHPEVTARLLRHRVALLRTEDWGNIWIEQINAKTLHEKE